jgi:phosphatidylethanolamine/phosphatidyl-N-methylethanolamine N-methyltransferase
LSAWLRARYSLYAAFYDLGPGFRDERRRAIELLDLAPGERVLVIGVGTGADLPLLPRDVQVLGVDLTPAMLAKASVHAGADVELAMMNAERLDLPDDSFDAVLLHQILEVVSEPERCLAEAARVLRPGGRLSIFDKFFPDEAPPTPLQRRMARLVDLVFTSVKLSFPELLAASAAPLVVEHQEPCSGPFRVMRLRKAGVAGAAVPTGAARTAVAAAR